MKNKMMVETEVMSGRAMNVKKKSELINLCNREAVYIGMLMEKRQKSFLSLICH